jgi:hypothetical protein
MRYGVMSLYDNGLVAGRQKGKAQAEQSHKSIRFADLLRFSPMDSKPYDK